MRDLGSKGDVTECRVAGPSRAYESPRMGRSSASLVAGDGIERHPDVGSSGRFPRRPSRSDALEGDVSWREMEKKVAARLASRAASREKLDKMDKTQEVDASSGSMPPSKTDERSPDSGVRANVVPRESALTYSAYTVAELEARGDRQALRTSMALPSPLSIPPSRWSSVGTSGLTVTRVFWSWARSPKPRPRVLDVVRAPLEAFVTELEAATKTLPWRKIGAVLAIAIGTFLALFAVVLTVAELTDDLKPARSSSTTTEAKARSATPADDVGAEAESVHSVVPSRPSMPAPSIDPPEVRSTLELEATPSASSASRQASKAVVVRGSAPKKPAAKNPPELFNP